MTMAPEGGIMNAAPRPWTARAAMIQVSPARARRAPIATANTTTPAMKTWTRLTMSQTRPPTATKAAIASR